MAVSSLVRLRGLIKTERTLAVLLPEAERLSRLDRRLGELLPAAVARRCRVMALDGSTLMVHCDNGAAASRLRSQAKSLAVALSRSDQPVQTLKVKVRADWSVPDKPEKPGLGPAALAPMADLARTLPQGDLKAALEGLLRHHRGSGD